MFCLENIGLVKASCTQCECIYMHRSTLVSTTLQKSVRFFRMPQKHRKGDFWELKSKTFHKIAWPWTPLEGTRCFGNESPSILGPHLIYTCLWALHKYITQVLILIARVSLHSAQEEDILTLWQVFLSSLACLPTIISVYKLSCPSLTWPTTVASITPVNLQWERDRDFDLERERDLLLRKECWTQNEICSGFTSTSHVKSRNYL